VKSSTATISVTTAWTVIEPTFDIGFVGVRAASGNVEVAYYDESGWSTEESATSPSVLKIFKDCSKIRIR
jgi:hypothetical protein